MNTATTLRARVSPDAISKVTRTFNGSLDDIFNELLQNARRAGATAIAISTLHVEDASVITLSDDGAGIDDPANLVSLGQSDWSGECRAREAPAGMGFFSLAGLDTVVSSASAETSFTLAISGPAWTSEADIEVLPWDGPMGTSISFTFAPQRDGKLERAVRTATRHYPLPVTLNGAPMPRIDFLDGAHRVAEREGYRIGVFQNAYWQHQDTINFHGLTLRHPLPVIKEVHHTQWSVKVDIVDAPDLVLMLPARKEVFRGRALEHLVDLCREVIFEAIRCEPFHRLTFEDRDLAKTFDNGFPEATRQLMPWQQVNAQDSYSETHQYISIAKHAANYADNGACDSVTFARARAFSRGATSELEPYCIAGPQETAFFTPVRQFEGYAWYDALSQYARTGETNRQADGADTLPEADPATFRPDTITLTLANQHGAELQLETDFAITESSDSWSDPDTARITLTRTSTLDPGELTELIIDAVFCPSDDCDADSYDTQESRFRHDAAVRAHAILQGEDAATLAGIRMAFADRVAWRIPHGRMLALTWSNAGSTLELSPAAKGSGQ